MMLDLCFIGLHFSIQFIQVYDVLWFTILYVYHLNNVAPDAASVNDSMVRSLREIEWVYCCQACEWLWTWHTVSQSRAEIGGSISRRAGGS
jgi:hypothetical protein